MATFKAEVYAHQKRSDGTWNIKIRVTHQKKKKYLPTPYYIYKEDLTRGYKIKNQHYIDECDKTIRKYRSICDSLGEKINTMDVSQIVEHINNSQEEHFDLDIVQYGRDIAMEMKAAGRVGNALAYINAINNMVKFIGRDRVSINEITVKFIQAWIDWIKDQPAAPKRIKGSRAQSLYPATLRAIHNRAKAEYNDEEAGVINIPLSPFKKIKLPKVVDSRKRALDPSKIRLIAQLDYTTVLQPGMNRFNLAKDIYILSFCLIGMNAVDLYSCTDYKNGRITYFRTKTKNRRSDRAEYSVLVPPVVMELFTKYRDPKGERVFNFYHHYGSVGAFTMALNVGLKKIGKLIDVDDLEFYSARHSWATIANNEAKIDKYLVHSALNHVDEAMKVTDIYIKKSWKPIDEANKKLLKYMKLNIGTTDEPVSRKEKIRVLLPKQKR